MMKNKIVLFFTAISIISFAGSAYAQDSNDNREIIYKPQKTTEKIIKSYNDTSTVYKYVPVDKDAKLLTPTDGVSLHKYLMSKIKLNSTDIPIGNILTFYYNVDEKGNVKNLNFKTRVTSSIEEQVAELINSLEYSPAMKNNENVAVEIIGGLNFSFFKRPRKIEAVEGSEWMPEFMGGESEMYKYIKDNLKYPRNSSSKGRTVIRFVVTEKGKVNDVTILKSSGSKVLDNTAKKIVERMPDWEPGLKNGKPVSVYFSLPFNFNRP